MPFNMKVSNEDLEGRKVIPPGIYEIKLIGFKPAASKDKTSINLNPSMEVIGNPDLAGRKLFDSLNTPGAAFYHSDFVHCFGLPMETDGTSSWIPGDWAGDPVKFKEDDPTTWVYKGPLVGRTGKAEVVVSSYDNKENNKINRYFCAIPDCATKFPTIKHSTNLAKKKD